MLYPLPRKLPELESFASATIGDGKTPDVSIVTDRGVVVTVTRDFRVAYRQWRDLSQRQPRLESALETRGVGVVCSVQPGTEPGEGLCVYDDSHMMLARR